jgi:hypothetical protein
MGELPVMEPAKKPLVLACLPQDETIGIMMISDIVAAGTRYFFMNGFPLGLW